MLRCAQCLRVLPALLLIAGAFAWLAPVSPVLAATTVTGCPTTEGQLQTDITNAGAGGTVQFACSSPTTINFNGGTGNTGPITISQDATLDASQSTGSVTFDGGNAVQLFVVNGGASLTLTDLTLQNASPSCTASGGEPHCSVYGGAIGNHGTLIVTGSTFYGNSPSCTASGRQHACSVFGGAIANQGTVAVTDSTFSANSPSCSTSDDAGCEVLGGAIYNESTVTITNTTVAGNSVTCSGDGCQAHGGAFYAPHPGILNFGATIVANNTPQNCDFTYGPTVNDWGYNLEYPGTNCGISSSGHDIVGQDPMLGPLADNGGPTRTMALLPGSPAIDYVPLGVSHNLCPVGGIDQRGYPRPDSNEAFCDIGAYEYQDLAYPTPNGQNAYDIESSNFACPGGGAACVPSGSYASDCLMTIPCPGLTYGDVEAFGPPTGTTSGTPDEVILFCSHGTSTGYAYGYLDVVSSQGASDYPAGSRSGPGVYGSADSGTISGKGTLIGGGGAEGNPTQPSSVNASAYDLATGIIGSVTGIQNTDNSANRLNSGQFAVTIRGKLWSVNLMGASPVTSRNTTSSTISCTVGGSHAYDLINAGMDTVSLAEGELENTLGDNQFLQGIFQPTSG